MKKSRKLLKSKLLGKYPKLVYGFTTRQAGDFRHNSCKDLAKTFRIDGKNIITMSQVHGKDVLEISEQSQEEKEVDGMITKIKNKFLVVKIADCVPILFFDPTLEIVAVCHAGWKGTIEGIQQQIIKKMQKMGSKASHIIAVLGPHIGPCCYKVDQERANRFKKFVIRKKEDSFLDLGKANIELLKELGVIKTEDLNICTSCQNDLLFSYRKEGPSYGEQVGLIGML